jgi:hypothetical protein
MMNDEEKRGKGSEGTLPKYGFDESNPYGGFLTECLLMTGGYFLPDIFSPLPFQ